MGKDAKFLFGRDVLLSSGIVHVDFLAIGEFGSVLQFAVDHVQVA